MATARHRPWLLGAGLAAASGAIALLVLVVLPYLGFAGCVLLSQLQPAPPPLPTIDGPEDATVLADVRVRIVCGRPDTPVEAISLPAGPLTSHATSKRAVRLSAPDRHGRFAYLCDVGGGRHQVRVASLTGDPEHTLFEREGDPNWHEPVVFLALAPERGRLAVGTRPYDTANPFQSRFPVELEIWSVEDGSHVSLGPVHAAAASWFPDARRLVVERLLDAGERTRHEPVPAELAAWTERSRHPDRLASVQVLDVETGTWTWVAWGAAPRAAPDGAHALCTLDGERWHVVDVASGTALAVDLPGQLGPPVGWLSERVLLYPARATTGSDPGVLRSPTKAPQAKWTLKAADIVTGRFVTVVPSVGRFDQFELGPSAH